MTTRHAAIVGWSAIAASTALLFALDALRMVHFHFNWFVAILLAISAGLVAFVVALSRRSAGAAPPPDDRNPPRDRPG
ncbi:MAG: hypothetical protein OXP07_23395 [Defluviicoccus sp.]|nr:hypothetical protein [Defluviicoccus sp.]